MTTTTSTNGTWARIELTRVSRDNHQNIKYRIAVEGPEELRAFLRRTVMVGKTSFFLEAMPLRELQHRMDGYLTQQGGRVFFPVYRLFELMEQAKYELKTCVTNNDVEIYMWRKGIEEDDDE